MLSKSLENISLDYCGACPSYIKGTNEVLTCFEEFGFFLLRVDGLCYRNITITYREFVEERAEQMLDKTVRLPGGAAMLVLGDAFCAATHTHTDYWLRRRER